MSSKSLAPEAPSLCNAELVAVVFDLEATGEGELTPGVLTVHAGEALPSGPLRTDHASLQRGMRHWVESLTGYRLGHTEQLYTFADTLSVGDITRLVRISYLALLHPSVDPRNWLSIYEYFPWEDRRKEGEAHQVGSIARRMMAWALDDATQRTRCAVAFGLEGHEWNDELVLQRYELMWQAGLVPESPDGVGENAIGTPMEHDQRRILATALSRIRAKIRYTPAVFDLLPERFTLFAVQQAVEALAGRPMHKQNFRRLLLGQQLVEETDSLDSNGHGRPARLYRFRRDHVQECYLTGARLPLPSLI